jgi:hypothetical protein
VQQVEVLDFEQVDRKAEGYDAFLLVGRGFCAEPFALFGGPEVRLGMGLQLGMGTAVECGHLVVNVL